MRLNDLAKKYQPHVQFLCVYIKEGHPTDGVQSLNNLKDGILYEQPKTADERADIAAVCMLRYNFSFPMVLDDMTDAAESQYVAVPERLYVLNAAGRITYKGGLGPLCFDVNEFEQAVIQVAGVGAGAGE